VSTRVVVLASALALACGAAPPRVEPEATAARAADAGTTQAGTDLDGDGIVYENDPCPCEPEDLDGFEDTDGCPDPDNDGDRILDVCDLCPNEVETYNGRCDGDGCPDRSHICVEQSRIAILEYVWFARGSSTPIASSTPILDALAATLNGNPQLTLVALIGQAEPHERRRQGLALARAQAVLEAMVERGVDRRRLVAEGDPAPMHDPSETSDRWRRVRFVIRVMNGEPYDESAPTTSDCGGPDSCEVPECTPPPPMPPLC
jgi:outer membrane protein OmpA-like peptidoglycan-associated protein